MNLRGIIELLRDSDDDSDLKIQVVYSYKTRGLSCNDAWDKENSMPPPKLVEPLFKGFKEFMSFWNKINISNKNLLK